MGSDIILGLQFFADADDVPFLLNRLNEDPELAFIVRYDPWAGNTGSPAHLVAESREHIHPTSELAVRCKAVKQVQSLTDASSVALRRLRSGIAYYANNWDLGPVLKSSTP
jgi:hypothetical protein